MRAREGAGRPVAGDRASSTSTSCCLARSASASATSWCRTQASAGAVLCVSRSASLESGRAGVGEAVADSRHGQDVIRTRGLALDLPPEVANVDVDDACLDRVFVAPDRVEDLLPAEHLARIAGEEGQQVELGMGELHFLV